MDKHPNLAAPAEWLQQRFERIKNGVPPYLRPKFFAITISTAYKAARAAALEQFSEFVSTGHKFTQDLALCAVQMYGVAQSASLDPSKATPSLAAGLPHFSTEWARCWGRDVFISLRGLFLTTGNYEGARKHILAFASTLKHGLIPNLLDSARNPRYVVIAPALFVERMVMFMQVQLTRLTLVDVAKYPRLRQHGPQWYIYPL